MRRAHTHLRAHILQYQYQCSVQKLILLVHAHTHTQLDCNTHQGLDEETIQSIVCHGHAEMVKKRP